MTAGAVFLIPSKDKEELAMAATNQQLVAGLYTAFFNRAPDQEGFQFWTDRFADGATVNILAGEFAGHPVFEATYGGMDDETFVNSIYTNILGGPGDAEGVEFWVGQLGSGMSRDQFVAEFVYASLNYDGDDASALQRQAFLTNKSDVGIYFATTMGEQSNLDPETDPRDIASLEADPAYAASQQAIASVTHDPATVTAAQTAIDEAAGDTGGDNTHTLTDEVDAVDLTATADAQDVVVLAAATNSQLDVPTEGPVTLATAAGFDTVAGFQSGTGETADRLNLSALAIEEARQGLLDVSATVTGETDLTSVEGLFADGEAQHAVAYAIDGENTWVLVDANMDGNFTAADDVAIALTGVNGVVVEDFVF